MSKSYKTGCYVCSLMLKPATQITLTGKPMNRKQAKCFASYAGVGYQHPSIVFNESVGPRARVGLKDQCDKSLLVDYNYKIKGTPLLQKVFLDVKPGHRYEMCYGRLSGSIPLGRLDVETQCRDNRFVIHGGGALVKNGTYNIRGGWWLCGDDAYTVLPPDWTGVCTPIFVTDHTFLKHTPTRHPD